LFDFDYALYEFTVFTHLLSLKVRGKTLPGKYRLGKIRPVLYIHTQPDLLLGCGGYGNSHMR